MQLIFLNRNTLSYKDFAPIQPDFEIVLDMVVSQKSTFTLNKKAINASIGDVVILKHESFSYIGILEGIISGDDGTLKIHCQDFKELFNIKVPVETYSGDLCALLSSKIRQAFVENEDTRQCLKYLDINVRSSVYGKLTYDADCLISIDDLIELLLKSYNIIVKYKVGFLRGRFTSIRIIIEEVAKSAKLRYDFKEIRDLSISDSDINSINKITFYPKKENKTHKAAVSYYLLRNGGISDDRDAEGRYEYVNATAEYYSDDDYDSLKTKAQSSLCSAISDHEITFTLSVDNNVFIPLVNVFLGFYIEFYGPNKTYDTLLTQIKYKKNFDVCYLTLGEQRTSLTDKIKLLKKGIGSSGGNISVSTTITDVDGGNY